MITRTNLVGAYGPDWKTGILAEHLHLALDAGWVLHRPAHGRTMFVTELGSWDAIPVLCGEIVSIPTEDGPVTGRCGGVVERDGFACPGHTAELDGWRAMSEAEKCEWERRVDAEMG